MYLYQVTSPYFVAGIEVSGSLVVRAAPIIRYMIGWEIGRVVKYANHKGWEVEEVETPIS